MGAPATFRILLFDGDPNAVDPLHCTTVLFRLAVAVNARVEVMSARVVPNTIIGLAVFVRVATNSKSSHCTVATALQSKLLPMGAVFVNWTRAVVGRKGSTIQSRRNPCVTVQL